MEIIDGSITRDFIPSKSCVLVLHRLVDNHDIYFINNFENNTVELEAFFRAKR